MIKKRDVPASCCPESLACRDLGPSPKRGVGAAVKSHNGAEIEKQVQAYVPQVRPVLPPFAQSFPVQVQDVAPKASAALWGHHLRGEIVLLVGGSL